MPATGQPPPAPAPVSTPVPTPIPLPTTATPEQVGSVLRVRVAFGGLPARDTVAALLHRDEIADESLVAGNARFVLTLFTGWQEDQLRDQKTRIIVYRNKSDEGGEVITRAFQARLVQFDAGTGLGVVAYEDDFDYSLDVGFRLQRGSQASSDFLLLRTVPSPDRSPQDVERPTYPSAFDRRPRGREGPAFTQALEQRRVRVPPFDVDVGAYRGSRGEEQRLELPPRRLPRGTDPVLLGVDSPDRLTGFVHTSPDGAGAVFTPLDQFELSIRPPTFTVSSVEFRSETSGYQRFRMILILDSASESSPTQQVWLHKREVPASDDNAIPQPDAVGNFRAISQDKIVLERNYGAAGTLSTRLESPAMNQKKAFLVQLSWSFLPGENQKPQIYGRPFLLNVERTAGGVYPAVTGLTSASEGGSKTASTTPDQAAAKFPLEAAAQSVHVVAGGRGALIELHQAPFWKLFWFEKNDWLPLPGNLGTVSVTGNLSTLFILDRGAREVRKFKLPSMEPAGSTKLPHADYLVILAGCNSEHAPIHVLAADDALALDPATLERRDVARKAADNSRSFTEPEGKRLSYSVTGDGLGFWRFADREERFFHYNNDARGVELSYLGLGRPGFGGTAGVTGGFTLDNGLQCRDMLGGEKTSTNPPATAPESRLVFTALAENAPVVFNLFRPSGEKIPPKPTRVSCVSFFSSLPFAEVDVPEMAGVAGEELDTKKKAWIFLDPYSRQLATLDAERKTWTVRKLALNDGNADQPVLLNWPDTTVPRGGKFRFRPELTGGKEFTAALVGRPDLSVVDKGQGAVEFTMDANAFETLHILPFQVPSKKSGEGLYPILVHRSGPQSPFAAPLSAKIEGLNSRGADLPSLGSPNKQFQQLDATLHRFSDPIQEIPGAVEGCAILITASNRVDFFDLQKRQVTGSIAGPPGAWYYPGAGALFEYDPGKRTLTRIRVPNGQREQTLAFPPNMKLTAIGVGTQRGSPLTLFVNVAQDKGWPRFSDLTITTPAFQTSCAVLDSLTLKAGMRPQPVHVSRILGKKSTDDSISFSGSSDAKPVRLPASHNGTMVNLPREFLALGANYAVAYPCERPEGGMDLSSANFSISGGSISGLMAFSNLGEAFKGNIKVGQIAGGQEFGSSPCGRYQMRRIEAEDRENCIEVRLAESDQPLLRIARLAFMEGEQFHGEARRHVVMLGDNGPLGVLSSSGKALQLVNLDLPAVAKAIAEDEFHVVSQPVPLVMEGGTMQYQVQVNNASAVLSVQLQRPVPGISITAGGLLSYRAPGGIAEPTRTTISIKIRGKNGKVVLHEFPVYVLPFPRPGTKMKVREI